MGNKTQQNFLYIDFNQVYCKTQEQDWTASSPPDGLSLISLPQLPKCFTCPNEGSSSPIYTNQLRVLLTQLG